MEPSSKPWPYELDENYELLDEKKKLIDTNLPQSNASVTFSCHDTACEYRVMVITAWCLIFL